MRKTIKHIHILLIVAITYIMATSCENYRDDNGDLGGMWQLTEWRQTDSQTGQEITKATNEDGYYYSFHQKIMQFVHSSKADFQYDYRYHSLFRHTPDSIIIYNVTNYMEESLAQATLLTPVVLSEFGVPNDGRFHIDVLDGNKMVLSYKDNTLYFRKY